jgi:hypothetical protein
MPPSFHEGASFLRLSTYFGFDYELYFSYLNSIEAGEETLRGFVE